MSALISTMTSKGQVTVPQEVRERLHVAAGQRIAWEADGDRYIVRRVRSALELAGCLKDAPPAEEKEAGKLSEWAHAAIERDKRSKTNYGKRSRRR